MRIGQITSNLDVFTDHKGGLGALKEYFLSTAFKGNLALGTVSDSSSDFFLDLQKCGSSFESNKEMSPNDLSGIWEGFVLYDLPKSWKWMRLDQIGTIVGGGTPDTANSTYWTKDSGTPWITPADMRHQGMYVLGGKRNLTDAGLRESSSKLLPVDSVVFSSRAPIGYVGIAGLPLATNQGFKSCVPFMPETAKFIYFYLMFIGAEINRRATGTTFKEVSGKQFAATPIPVPPLNVQQRIVEEIQEFLEIVIHTEDKINSRTQLANSARKSALDAISTAQSQKDFEIAWKRIEENWKVMAGTPESIESLRNLILSLAISGNLTKDFSPEDSVEDLLVEVSKTLSPYPEISDERFVIPSDWKWVSLASVAEHQLGKMLHTAKMKGIRRLYLRSVNVRPDGTIDLTDLNEMLIPEAELEKYNVKNGDLFVNEGGDVGRNAIFDLEIDFDLAFQNQLHRLRPVSGIEGRYIQFVLRQAKSQGVISQMSSGVTIQHFSASALRRFAIPLPPLSEQKLIVEKVNHLMKFCDDLEREILGVTHFSEKFSRSVVSASA
jgi:type I restriction enzyme S subunit